MLLQGRLCCKRMPQWHTYGSESVTSARDDVISLVTQNEANIRHSLIWRHWRRKMTQFSSSLHREGSENEVTVWQIDREVIARSQEHKIVESRFHNRLFYNKNFSFSSNVFQCWMQALQMPLLQRVYFLFHNSQCTRIIRACALHVVVVNCTQLTHSRELLSFQAQTLLLLQQ